MNRLKKIFSSLSDIGIVPASTAIRAAWAVVKAHHPSTGDAAHMQAIKLIDRIVEIVVGIAEDTEKASDKAQVGQ